MKRGFVEKRHSAHGGCLLHTGRLGARDRDDPDVVDAARMRLVFTIGFPRERGRGLAPACMRVRLRRAVVCGRRRARLTLAQEV